MVRGITISAAFDFWRPTSFQLCLATARPRTDYHGFSGACRAAAPSDCRARAAPRPPQADADPYDVDSMFAHTVFTSETYNSAACTAGTAFGPVNAQLLCGGGPGPANSGGPGDTGPLAAFLRHPCAPSLRLTTPTHLRLHVHAI